MPPVSGAPELPEVGGSACPRLGAPREATLVCLALSALAGALLDKGCMSSFGDTDTVRGGQDIAGGKARELWFVLPFLPPL